MELQKAEDIKRKYVRLVIVLLSLLSLCLPTFFILGLVKIKINHCRANYCGGAAI